MHAEGSPIGGLKRPMGHPLYGMPARRNGGLRWLGTVPENCRLSQGTQIDLVVWRGASAVTCVR